MKKYKLRYLPIFEEDLYEAVFYIKNVLNNPQKAEKLIKETESAILDRLQVSLAFEPYQSAKTEKMFITEYMSEIILFFYVVLDDMVEVRHFIYSRRDFDSLL